MNFVKVFKVVAMVSTWFGKAAEDGKIDAQELIDLVSLVIFELGLDIKINV